MLILEMNVRVRNMNWILHVVYKFLQFVLHTFLPFSPYYWTDMFTVNVNISNSQRICSDWIEQDQELQLITSDDVSPCPCSLDVVLIDTTRFHVDPLCVNTGSSDFNCPYQPSAMACFKQNIPS